MSSTVEKIKDRLSISDVISSYIKLDPNGINYKARCPFHNEKTPSFFVSSDRGGYYCFGCNAKGDMFTFVQEFEGVDFKGALKILAERAGVSIVYDVGVTDTTDRLYRIMEIAQEYFVGILQKHSEVNSYLSLRGLTSDTIEYFKIGYVSNDWQALYDYLKGKHFSDKEIETVGLIKKGDSGRYYDRFRGRIMFPINDSSGRVVAFTGRLFVDDGKSAKYLNSPETELFVKSKTLYGFDRAKFDIKKRDYAILVEGQMDLIMSHQAGFTNTVASSGTAITKEGLMIISRLSSNIMIAFDKDSAGITAARRAAAISALSLDMVVKVVAIPEGKDPADAIHASVDIWKEALRNAKDIMVFELEQIVSTKQQSLWMKEIESHVFSYLAVMTRDMKIDSYIRIITEHTGLSPDSIRTDFNTYLKKRASNIAPMSQTPNNTTAQPNQFTSIEKKLYGISLYLKDKDTYSLLHESIQLALATLLSHERLRELEMMPTLDKDAILFEIELTTHLEHIEKEIKELLINLEEEQLMKQFTETQQALRRAESAKDSTQTDILIQKCNELSKRFNDITKRRSHSL